MAELNRALYEKLEMAAEGHGSRSAKRHGDP
jgi:hypothetical protein